MRVWVTGADGFVGRAIVRRLVASAVLVTASTRNSGGDHPGATMIVTGDLAEPTGRMPDAVDAIVHAAARSPRTGVAVDSFVRDNLLATSRVADYALAKGCPLVFLSGISVYGRVEAGYVDESTPIMDPGPYGMSKRMCELLLEERSQRGLSALILRLPGILGPGAQTPWLASVLRQLRAGAPIPVYEPQGLFNNAIHVNDVADFALSWLRRPGSGTDIVTVGAAGPRPMRDVIQLLAKAANAPEAQIMEREGGASFIIRSDRATARYGYQPRPLDELLQRYAAEG